MKAKEYFEKYETRLLEQDPSEGIKDFINELGREVSKLIEERKCKTDHAIISVIKEINQKYNSVMNLYRKKYGKAPLVRDGFLVVVKDKFPFLKDYI